MEIYRASPGCLLRDLIPAWLILIRAECSCGHRTRAYLTANGVASALIRHQAEAGTRVA